MDESQRGVVDYSQVLFKHFYLDKWRNTNTTTRGSKTDPSTHQPQVKVPVIGDSGGPEERFSQRWRSQHIHTHPEKKQLRLMTVVKHLNFYFGGPPDETLLSPKITRLWKSASAGTIKLLERFLDGDLKLKRKRVMTGFGAAAALMFAMILTLTPTWTTIPATQTSGATLQWIMPVWGFWFLNLLSFCCSDSSYKSSEVKESAF